MYDPHDGTRWHPVWDTLRSGFCLVLLAMLGAEIYQHGGWWAVLLAVVIFGGMAS